MTQRQWLLLLFCISLKENTSLYTFFQVSVVLCFTKEKHKPSLKLFFHLECYYFWSNWSVIFSEVKKG